MRRSRTLENRNEVSVEKHSPFVIHDQQQQQQQQQQLDVNKWLESKHPDSLDDDLGLVREPNHVLTQPLTHSFGEMLKNPVRDVRFSMR
jgi:hypothetical protein